ncbi:MAG: hypothetical protein ACLQFR_02410 [Streptosporangiaceae bacterium]
MRPVHAVLAAAAAAATLAAGGTSALAAPAGRAAPALSNPGATSPSLAMKVSAGGDPEVAAIGSQGSLQYYTQVKGKWTRKQLAGKNSAFSGPALVSGPGGDAAVAVEGPNHSLLVYVKTSGKWKTLKAAGKNSAYSAPSFVVGASGVVIAVLGKNHSLWYYWYDPIAGKWHNHEILGANRAYSAPSLFVRSSGQADIAVEGADHTVSYLSATNPLHWTNDVVGPVGSAYSAPSLVVFSGKFDPGAAFIVVEGPRHELVDFAKTRGWSSHELEGPSWCYSAPSLAQNISDLTRPVEIAFQGSSHSITLLLFNAGATTPGWQNDVIVQATGSVNSAPALVDRRAYVAGEADLVFQGSAGTLWYYDAPEPSTAGLAPSFTGLKIGAAGTTFGG